MILIYDLWSNYCKKDQRSQSKISNMSIILVFSPKMVIFVGFPPKCLNWFTFLCHDDFALGHKLETSWIFLKYWSFCLIFFEKRSRSKIKDQDQRSWSLILQWSRSIAVIFDLFEFWSRSLVMILIFDLDQIYGDLTQAWVYAHLTDIRP